MPDSLNAMDSFTHAPASAAVISLHTSPFSQPGAADSGGMNVYIRELSQAIAHRGHDITIYVRRSSADGPFENDPVQRNDPAEKEVEPGVRLMTISAGPTDLPKEKLPAVVDEFAHKVLRDIEARGGVDVIHAHYWLSGMAGHILKHELDCPLLVNFHTLARARWGEELSDAEVSERAEQEQIAIDCSDTVVVSCGPEQEHLEEFYDVEAERIAVVPPGVEHGFFSPGHRASARRAIGFGEGPLLLFVGRITPLKNPTLAVETLARLPEARLAVVGGLSGTGGEAEMRSMRATAECFGVADRISYVSPKSHRALSSYYRAADAVLIPSHSESFGLVALEAAASGTPVVAASVGGLRSLVEHGSTGFLVPEPDPELYAALASEILEDGSRAAEMSMNAVELAAGYSWESAGKSLSQVYSEVLSAGLLDCLV